PAEFPTRKVPRIKKMERMFTCHYVLILNYKNMKMRTALILILSCAQSVLAQNLSWKSNDIHIDFEKPLSSRGIPFIQWIQPSFDYTSSADGKVSIEAVVKSEPDLAQLSMSLINTKTGVMV